MDIEAYEIIVTDQEFVSKWSPYAWGINPEIHPQRLLVLSKVKAANLPE